MDLIPALRARPVVIKAMVYQTMLDESVAYAEVPMFSAPAQKA